MVAISVVLCLVIVGLTVVQAQFAYRFVRVLRRAEPAPVSDAQCPKSTVILCLRGTDPFLETTLRGLLNQDYPCYDVRIVVDSEVDPAWQLVHDVLAQGSRCPVQVSALREPLATCSLKCSSLLQAVAGLDDSYEVIALLDADTLPHASWLRELVAPLADPTVGAATGNRWYMPAIPSWGAIVRYQWNAAAAVQMHAFQIAWGGTLALRAAALRQSDVFQRWALAFGEDTMIYSSLRKLGLRVAFVPSLMMVNRENCTLRGFLQWMRRQLLSARLYHPKFFLVVLHGLLTSAGLIAAAALLPVAMVRHQAWAAAVLAATLAGYLAAMVGLLAMLEHEVRRSPRLREEPLGRFDLIRLLRILLAIPLTQAAFAGVLLSALWVRRVKWRGVEYEIQGPWKIRLLGYFPYRAEPGPAETLNSL
jgi:cellulose synthase/poly-beta-1,6-N-acetylglucosamine synthase-like glycosyltransferase